MITGVIKNKIDKIWTDIWAGGMTNPLTIIEQLTYLMFIRSLDEKELAQEEFDQLAGITGERIFPQTEEGQSMRWSKFKDKDPRDIFEIMSQRVFPFIKTLSGEESTAFSRYMEDAMFLIPTAQVLQKVITGLDDLYEHDLTGLDMQGDLYEYMLGKLATAGQNGQFRTPKHIREMMVELLAPTPDDTICDPACGTAGFLVSTAEYIRKHYEMIMNSGQWEHFAGPAFHGFDTDRTMLRISAMNLMLHSITNPDIDYKDSVSKQNTISDKFSIILANPPFKGTVDAESIHDNLKAVTNTKKTELLFLALFLRMLKKGGRCACIVPDGVLFGSSKAHKSHPAGTGGPIINCRQLSLCHPVCLNLTQGYPLLCWCLPKQAQAVQTMYGFMICRLMALVWMTNALPLLRTIFRISLPVSIPFSRQQMQLQKKMD